MRSALAWAMAALLALPGTAAAQCGLLGGCSPALVTEEMRKGLVDFVTNPAGDAPLERVARALLPSILGELDVDVKLFESDEADRTGLGIAYDFARDLTRWGFTEASANVSGGTFAVHANGNVAFDPDINPRDFLRTGGSIGWVWSRGGVTDTVPLEVAAELTDIALELADVPAEDIAAHPLNQRALEVFSRALGTQVVITLDGNVEYEADQAFAQRQVAYGGRLGIDVKAWNAQSALARYNVFDLPFAITRWLTGVDPVVRPRGSALPALLLGLDQVDPAEDSMRAAVENVESYARVVAEAGYRTVAARMRGGLVHASVNARVYQQLGASEAIEAAELDRFAYVVIALTAPNGTYVSWSTGRLPFDRREDQVYEVGWRYRF